MKKINRSNRSITTKLLWVIFSTLVGIYFSAPFFFAIATWFFILILLQVITKHQYSGKFEIFILIFLILTNYMWGSSWLNFYDTVPWRDEMLHFLYGMGFTFLWFKIIYSIFSKNNIKEHIGIIISFAFCFAVAFGAIWEIYEYKMDQWFGSYFEANHITLMQSDKARGQDAITDTMDDIILETISALIMCWILFSFLKYGKFSSIWNFEIVVKKKWVR